MDTKRPLPLPPGPRPRIPGAIFRQLRRGPLAFFTRITQQYGDVVSFKNMGTRYIILNHPDLAREVLLTQADAFWKGPALQNSKAILGEGLLTAEGDSHRRQRKMLQGAFHAKHVEGYAPVIIQSTEEMLATWREQNATAQGPREVRGDMMGLTLVIAGRALFGTMLAGDIQTVHRCMDDLMNNYARTVVPWGKLLNRLPIPSTLKLARAQMNLRQVVQRMIDARRESKQPGHDLLSTMIAATDTEDAAAAPTTAGSAAAACPHANGHPAKANTALRFNDAQLRDQAITILTASHETTANALTFTLYLLAQHSAEQALLREEARAVLGDQTPTVEMLDRFVRTRWVLSESMRLYPPAWTLGRQNQREVHLGGYRIPPKCTVLIPQWTLHRDPRFFPDPLAFKPDRWQNPAHPRFAYIPFSTGPRNCIGESFAWVEMLLLLPMLLREFTFSLPADAPEMQLTPAITLRPRNAVNMLVQRQHV